MTLKEQISELKKLNLPRDEFVVVGSGAMAARGIREGKDIDVIVTPELWAELSKDHQVGKNKWGIEHIEIGDIEILNPDQSSFSNSKVFPREELFSNAEEIEGIKFMSLEHLKKIKLKLGREIDLKDIKLIDEYLGDRK